MAKIKLDSSYRTKKGPMRVVVTSDVLTYDFDNPDLLKAEAEASRDALAAAIRGVSQAAAPATLAKRRRRGNSDRRQYPGPPRGATGSNRLFNDSGYLANNLAVVKNANEWDVVAPRGRLDVSLGRRLAEVLRRAGLVIDSKGAAVKSGGGTPKTLDLMIGVRRRVRRR